MDTMTVLGNCSTQCSNGQARGLPNRKPPPCIYTRTGNFASVLDRTADLGVYILRCRQSSDPAPPRAPPPGIQKCLRNNTPYGHWTLTRLLSLLYAERRLLLCLYNRLFLPLSHNSIQRYGRPESEVSQWWLGIRHAIEDGQLASFRLEPMIYRAFCL